MNRLELTANRLEDDFINFTSLMSKNEDADIAEVIMNLQNEENVYRASLSAGARVIQPSLVDFLK
jgi:flagellar hook-associated protein 3 FlgL